MIVGLAIAIPGILLLIGLVIAGIVAGPGRRSDQVLVAPRGARYSDATRILRAAAKEEARASREKAPRDDASSHHLAA